MIFFPSYFQETLDSEGRGGDGTDERKEWREERGRMARMNDVDEQIRRESGRQRRGFPCDAVCTSCTLKREVRSVQTLLAR